MSLIQTWKALRPIVLLVKKYGLAVFNKALEAVEGLDGQDDLANEEKKRRAIAIIVFFANQVGVRVEAVDVEKLIKIAIILVRLRKAANA